MDRNNNNNNNNGPALILCIATVFGRSVLGGTGSVGG